MPAELVGKSATRPLTIQNQDSCVNGIYKQEVATVATLFFNYMLRNVCEWQLISISHFTNCRDLLFV